MVVGARACSEDNFKYSNGQMDSVSMSHISLSMLVMQSLIIECRLGFRLSPWLYLWSGL